MATKIAGLTAFNVRALDECFPDLIEDGVLALGKTWASFKTDPGTALDVVSRKIDELPGKSHPKASLWAVERKLRKLVLEQQLDAVREQPLGDVLAEEVRGAETFLRRQQEAVQREHGGIGAGLAVFFAALLLAGVVLGLVALAVGVVATAI